MDIERELNMRYSGTYIKYRGRTLRVSNIMRDDGIYYLSCSGMGMACTNIPMLEGTVNDEIELRPTFGFVRGAEGMVLHVSRLPHRGYKYGLTMDGLEITSACTGENGRWALTFDGVDELFKEERSDFDDTIDATLRQEGYGAICSPDVAVVNTNFSTSPVIRWLGFPVGKVVNEVATVSSRAHWLVDKLEEFFPEVRTNENW